MAASRFTTQAKSLITQYFWFLFSCWEIATATSARAASPFDRQRYGRIHDGTDENPQAARRRVALAAFSSSSAAPRSNRASAEMTGSSAPQLCGRRHLYSNISFRYVSRARRRGR